ncbi:conserved hypothetical protein [Paenibacillus curdlanolyticus YK9]|uniref:DUF4321 domain-containing protein n=1 Tax=Paenibacillus curdlanolyticus YK9 TaxID=717606 RepID=E0IDU4_9BACL|nr:DUF4321 domain-containing protein [Paenibacillus curdlanolyticus]EFM09298.1 conserved hypothetical protein [Paenibacillus curdlanolyticus YK9]
MKKNGWTLLLFIVLGLLSGALVAKWLKKVSGLSFLTNTSTITWSPDADLYVFSYDLTIRLELSLLSILGVVAAIWLYRKL